HTDAPVSFCGILLDAPPGEVRAEGFCDNPAGFIATHFTTADGHARTHPRYLRHLHGIFGGACEGARLSCERLGPERVSAHEHAARTSRHHAQPGLRP